MTREQRKQLSKIFSLIVAKRKAYVSQKEYERLLDVYLRRYYLYERGISNRNN